MQDQTVILKKIEKIGPTSRSESDIAEILLEHSIESNECGGFLSVGDSSKESSAILFVSLIASQLKSAIHKLAPLLKENELSFILPANEEVANNILRGGMGYSQIGKIITIYLPDRIESAELLRNTISLTASYKGPEVPGSVFLGGTCYRPALPEEHKQKKKGIGSVMADRFRVTSILKEDAKGNVYKALYIKGLMAIGQCVIKQGKNAMWANDAGFDMHDSLKWQKLVHEELKTVINVPKIIDLFEDKRDLYLAMEYIKGVPLNKYLDNIYQKRPWMQLPKRDKLKIIGILLKIVAVLKNFHKEGYIHRDLSPANFLVKKDESIYLIDLEFTYSYKEDYPCPPFGLGTQGFISPEQLALMKPTFADDIYGLGSLMLVHFTNMPPLKFGRFNHYKLQHTLSRMVGDPRLAHLIGSCFHRDVPKRPFLSKIELELLRIQTAISYETTIKHEILSFDYCGVKRTGQIIRSALKGLTLPHFLTEKKLFGYAIGKDYKVGNLSQFAVGSYGLLNGIVSISLIIKEAKKKGFKVDTLISQYSPYYANFYNKYCENKRNTQADLANGSTGFSIGLVAAETTRLFSSNMDETLFTESLRGDLDNLTLFHGNAGRGMAILAAKDCLPREFTINELASILEQLEKKQKRNGSWLNATFSVANGNAGILLFLISYHRVFPSERTGKLISKGLSYLASNREKQNKFSLFQGIAGHAFVFIKAYEVFKDLQYRRKAENLLNQMPDYVVEVDYSLATGLAGYGLVYLSAYKVFGSIDWLKRAEFIATHLSYTFIDLGKSGGYWNIDGTDTFDPSLASGQSGVILFLLEYYSISTLDNQ